MKVILVAVLLLNITNSFSQTIQAKYFNNRYLQKETAPQKGRFMQTVIQNSDGSITTQVVDLKKNETISTETFKGKEPAGVWKYKRHNIPKDLDYCPLKE